MGRETPSTPTRAIVAMFVFAAVGFVVLPASADGQRSAYVSFAIAFVVGVIAGVLYQRFGPSHKPGNADVWIIVGVGLIARALAPPAVETAIYGFLSGSLVGGASTMLLERRTAPQDGG